MIVHNTKWTRFRLVLRRMFTRWGDRRANTAGRPRAFDERPYKQISAEMLFSLPICVIMGLHRRAGACSRRDERLESKKAAGVNPRPTKGYGLCPKPL